MIPFAKIKFSKEEEKAVIRVLRSGILSQGEEIKKFENEFANYIKVKYAVAVSSGTSALHLALLSLGIGYEDEVITTPFSFIASTNSIIYTGAKPIFVDITTDFSINVNKIEEKITAKTKAILPVHLFGNPCDMDKIMQIAKKYNLAVIEDACQAHGAEYKSIKVGKIGDIGCFSFYATKNITTGEGGIITTNNFKIYKYLIKARSHGSQKKYHHEFIGYNYRMTDIQAAIGRVQLRKLDSYNNKRIKNANYLNKKLIKIPGIKVPIPSLNNKSVFHLYSIILTPEFPVSRKQLLKQFKKYKIAYSIAYPIPIHKQKSIQALIKNEDLPISEYISKQVVSLPIHPYLKKSDLDLIIQAIFNSLNS